MRNWGGYYAIILPVTLFNELTGSYIYHVIILLSNVCLDLNIYMFGHSIKIYWVFSKLNRRTNWVSISEFIACHGISSVPSLFMLKPDKDFIFIFEAINISARCWNPIIVEIFKIFSGYFSSVVTGAERHQIFFSRK